jgi:hypothetical protein
MKCCEYGSRLAVQEPYGVMILQVINPIQQQVMVNTMQTLFQIFILNEKKILHALFSYHFILNYAIG